MHPYILNILKKCVRAGLLLSAFFLPLPLLLPSCSADNPVILRSDARRLWVQDSSGNFAERLSVFVLFKSGSDPENFGSMTVIHDDTGIEWNLTAENAAVISPPGKSGDSLWIGSPVFSPVYSGDGASFPEGVYSVCVRDLAGNEEISSFSLESRIFPETSPVSVELEVSERKKSGSRLFIRSEENSPEFSKITLIFLDKDGNPFYTFPVGSEMFTGGSAEIPVSVLEEKIQPLGEEVVSGFGSVQCFAGNASGTAGVLLFPVSLGYDDGDE